MKLLLRKTDIFEFPENLQRFPLQCCKIGQVEKTEAEPIVSLRSKPRRALQLFLVNRT